MSELEENLRHAGEAIAKDDWRQALEHVLAAWREQPGARLADLVVRVAKHLPCEGLRDKTLSARQGKWLELAARKDSADVGVLLATPWPTRWQDNVPLMTALAAMPDDPRIALAVAEHASETPYDTWHCVEFYRPALGLVARSADRRTKPVLATALTRERTYKWTNRVRPIFEHVLSGLEEEIPLGARDGAAVAAIEALFTGEVDREKNTEKSEAEFLDAIRAAPNDDMPRAVYADWLTEKGDPRGEFIAGQLAGERSASAEKRMTALLRKHGATWAGPIAMLFEEEGRHFERGFFAGGVLVPDAEAALVGDEHRTALRGLRVLENVSESTAARIAEEGLAPNLEALFLHAISPEISKETKKRRALLANAFPELKTLGLKAPIETVIAYFGTPLPPKLERLVVQHDLGSVQAALEKTPLKIFESRQTSLAHPEAWRFELLRDPGGQLTRLRAGPIDPTKSVPKTSNELAWHLAKLPQLTELVVYGTRCLWASEEVARVEPTIGAMKSLRKVDTPWERGLTEALITYRGHVEPNTLRLFLRYKDDSVRFLTDYPKLWRALTSPPLSLALDSLCRSTTSSDGVHRALGKDPVTQLQKELTKQHTFSVTAYSKHRPNAVNATFGYYDVFITIPRGPDFRLDDFLSWLEKTIADEDFKSVDSSNTALRGDELYQTGWVLKAPEAPDLHWITTFTRKHARFYDLDEVAKAATMTMKGCRVIRTATRLVLVSSDSPEVKITEAERDAFSAELTKLFKGERKS